MDNKNVNHKFNAAQLFNRVKHCDAGFTEMLRN